MCVKFPQGLKFGALSVTLEGKQRSGGYIGQVNTAQCRWKTLVKKQRFVDLVIDVPVAMTGFLVFL